MRRLQGIVTVLSIALSACGAPGSGAGTDVTAAPSTTMPTTSTTADEQTTTTRGSSTTSTTTRLSGTWGARPLIAWDDWGGMALGWWDGSGWVQVEADTDLPVTGGEDYQVALLGSEAIVEGSAPVNSGCEVVFPNLFPGIRFDDGNALYTEIDDGKGGQRVVSGVAVTAPWSLTPRTVTRGEAHPDLQDLAMGLLEERRFLTDSVEIVQAVDADIDGDGAIETFLVAEDIELGNEISDGYSMVFAVSPAWAEPLLIAATVIPADDTGYPASYRVSAVADLSGDGLMEVVVDAQAWESSRVAVHELNGTRFVERLEAGCGV